MLPIIFIQDLFAKLAFIKSSKPLPPLFALFGTAAFMATGYLRGGI